MSARRILGWCVGALLLALTGSAHAGSTKVMRVLPHLLDTEGRHTPAPSLYERDAHQAYLRRHPEKVGGLRFDIQYRANAYYFTPRLRLEVRGSKEPRLSTFEQPVRRTGWFGRWLRVSLSREAAERLGEVVAWRASLWDGEKLLAEHKSFLW
jgi:hypothetical protein